jgi:hypothetical protein
LRFLALIIVLLVVMYLLEKVINKLLGVKKKKISETPGRNVDRWGRSIILVIYLSTLWFVPSGESLFIIKLYWISFFILIFGFQVVMEFIYIKNSKQYLSTLFLLIISFTLIYFGDRFFFSGKSMITAIEMYHL